MNTVIKTIKSYKKSENDYIGKTLYHLDGIKIKKIVVTGFTKEYVKHTNNSKRSKKNNVFIDVEMAERKLIKIFIKNIINYHNITIKDIENIVELVKKYPEELL